MTKKQKRLLTILMVPRLKDAVSTLIRPERRKIIPAAAKEGVSDQDLNFTSLKLATPIAIGVRRAGVLIINLTALQDLSVFSFMQFRNHGNE